MTPYELNLHILEFSQQRRADQEDRITLAYLGAYWQRVKKMPSLEKVLKKTELKKPQAPQTPEQMFNVAKTMNEALNRK